MGVSLWDKLCLPLLIGVAIQIIVSALWFLSARLWKCLTKQRKTQTAASDGAQGHALPEVGATVIDLEMGNSFGSPEGQDSIAQPDLEMATENGGEGPKAQVTKSAIRGAIELAEVDVPQQRKAADE